MSEEDIKKELGNIEYEDGVRVAAEYLYSGAFKKCPEDNINSISDLKNLIGCLSGNFVALIETSEEPEFKKEGNGFVLCFNGKKNDPNEEKEYTHLITDEFVWGYEDCLNEIWRNLERMEHVGIKLNNYNECGAFLIGIQEKIITDGFPDLNHFYLPSDGKVDIVPWEGDFRLPDTILSAGQHGNVEWRVTLNGTLYLNPSKGTDGRFGEYLCELTPDPASIRRVSIEKGTALGEETGHLFAGMVNLERIYGLKNLDTSYAKSLCGLFEDCKKISSLDVSGFITEKTEDFDRVFGGCENLEKIYGLEDRWNMENAVYAHGMFRNCKSLESIDLSACYSTKLIGISGMFSGCDSLREIYLDNFDFSAVEFSGRLFEDCKNLNRISCEKMDFSSAHGSTTGDTWSLENMFSGCDNLKLEEDQLVLALPDYLSPRDISAEIFGDSPCAIDYMRNLDAKTL